MSAAEKKYKKNTDDYRFYYKAPELNARMDEVAELLNQKGEISEFKAFRQLLEEGKVSPSDVSNWRSIPLSSFGGC